MPRSTEDDLAISRARSHSAIADQSQAKSTPKAPILTASRPASQSKLVLVDRRPSIPDAASVSTARSLLNSVKDSEFEITYAERIEFPIDPPNALARPGLRGRKLGCVEPVRRQTVVMSISLIDKTAAIAEHHGQQQNYML